ncbi:MAG: hypothetical protein WAV31_00065 [Candidatus Moraniibacteriota bacterium]
MVTTVSVFAQDIQKGDSAKVPGRELVQIKNLEPIEEGSDSFVYDDRCRIRCGGTVTVIGGQNNLLLVRYKIDYDGLSVPCDFVDLDEVSPCPSGALFFITKEKFLSMNVEYDRIQAEKANEKNLVKKLLGK